MSGIVEGIVESYTSEDGIGVITSTSTPGGCWVHWSFLRDAYGLEQGQAVWFTFEAADQDGFDHRAVHVWTNRDLIGKETNVVIRVRNDPNHSSILTFIPDQSTSPNT